MKKISLDTFLPAGLIPGYKKIGDQLKENAKTVKKLAESMKLVVAGLDKAGVKASDNARAQKVANEKNGTSIKKLNTLQQERINLETKKSNLIRKAIVFNERNQQKNIRLIERANAEVRKTRNLVKAEIQFRTAQKGSIDKLNASNKILRDRLRGVNLETERGRKRAIALNRAIDRNTAKVIKNSDSLVKAKMNIGRYHTAFSKLGGLLRTGLGLLGITSGIFLLRRAFNNIINTLVDFEDTFSNVLTLLGDDDIKKYEGVLRKAATEQLRLGFAIEDTNKALFDAVSAGVKASESQEFMAVASKLAIGGVTTLSAAVDGLTTILNAYSLETSEAEKVASAFFSAQKFGKTTVDELTKSIGQAAPIAKQAGLSYQELLSTYAELTKQGINTELSTTAIKATLIAILKPSDRAKKKFNELGIATGATALKEQGLFAILQKVSVAVEDDADALAELIPNIRALTGVGALGTEQLKEYDEILKIVNEDYGDQSSLTKALELKQQDLKFATSELGGSWKELILLMQSSTGVMAKITRGFSGMIQSYVDWFKAQDEVKKRLNEEEKIRIRLIEKYGVFEGLLFELGLSRKREIELIKDSTDSIRDEVEASLELKTGKDKITRSIEAEIKAYIKLKQVKNKILDTIETEKKTLVSLEKEISALNEGIKTSNLQDKEAIRNKVILLILKKEELKQLKISLGLLDAENEKIGKREKRIKRIIILEDEIKDPELIGEVPDPVGIDVIIAQQAREEDAAIALAQAKIAIIQTGVDATAQILQNELNRQVQAELDAARQIADITQGKRESDEAFAKRKIKAEKKSADEIDRINKKAAQKSKVIAISQAIVNGALAITLVQAQTGVLSPLAIPLIVTNTLAQIAIIESQSFAKGTEFVHGSGTETSDSIPANLSFGERIINAEDNKYMKGLSNKDLKQAATMYKSTAHFIPHVIDSSAFRQDNSDVVRGISNHMAETKRGNKLLERQVFIDKNGVLTDVYGNKIHKI